jgi:large subunit ribosomal protein L9
MATHVQVVLKQDVANLGASGEVARVRPGYARNYLLPRGLAVLATRNNLKLIEHERQIALKKLELLKKEAEEAAEKLKKIVIMIAKEVGDEGRLFGSVTAADVADALKNKGVDVDRKKLVMPEEIIKTVGTYEIGVRLQAGVIAKIKLEVKTAA